MGLRHTCGGMQLLSARRAMRNLCPTSRYTGWDGPTGGYANSPRYLQAFGAPSAEAANATPRLAPGCCAPASSATAHCCAAALSARAAGWGCFCTGSAAAAPHHAPGRAWPQGARWHVDDAWAPPPQGAGARCWAAASAQGGCRSATRRPSTRQFLVRPQSVIWCAARVGVRLDRGRHGWAIAGIHPERTIPGPLKYQRHSVPGAPGSLRLDIETPAPERRGGPFLEFAAEHHTSR